MGRAAKHMKKKSDKDSSMLKTKDRQQVLKSSVHEAEAFKHRVKAQEKARPTFVQIAST
jgi:hypothetical protein